jgi:UDP-glucose 4-epimerase
MGFDPLLQFVHGDDAVGALEAAVRRPARGAVNVAGPGSISLTRLLRLAGRRALPVPSPLFGAALGVAARLGSPRLPPEAVPWLRDGVTIDVTRLIDEVGFSPRTTVATVEEFIERIGSGAMHRPRDGAPGRESAHESGRRVATG